MTLPEVIGHRGAAGFAPENTLASFRHAAGLGCAMVEFDVRLTADDQPVVFHDDTLERTTDGAGRVADHSLAAIKALDAGRWFAPAFAGEPVATLDEVLGLCLDLGLAINMEIKPDAGREAETTRRALDRARALWPAGRPEPLISSFAEECLALARDLAPGWPRGLLVTELPVDWRDRADRLDCATINADHTALTPEDVAAIRASGRAVLAYTVNDRARERVLFNMGIASVFSDFPHSS